MIAVTARVQREGEVVHFVVHRITDLSRELAGVGERDGSDARLQGERQSGRLRSVEPASNAAPHAGLRTRNMYVHDLHLDMIRVKPRDFR